MNNDQRIELEHDLLYFVKRVCRQEDQIGQSPEEVRVLPEIAKLLLNR